MIQHAATGIGQICYRGVFIFLLLMSFAHIGDLHAAADCIANYSTYGNSKLTVENNVTVNGNKVSKTDSSTYNSISSVDGSLHDITPIPPLPAIDPASFPGNSSNVNLENPVTVTAGAYKQIIIKNNITTTFVDVDATYHINNLIIEQNGNAIFAPGSYYIDVLTLEENAEITVSPSGLVKLYIKDKIKMSNNSRLNAAGVTADLQLFVYDSGVFEGGNHVEFKGTILAPGSSTKVVFGTNSTITGGVYSSGEVKWVTNSSHVYTSTDVSASAAVLGCPSLTLTDHFDINHDSTAVNCEVEPITIEAHKVDHTIDTGYTGTLNLSTSTGNGDWSVIAGLGVLDNDTANDGLATYNLVAADNGLVVLGLKNSVVETLNINVSDGAYSEITGAALTSEDQDLTFSQTGFRFIDAANVTIIGPQISGKDSNVAPGAQTLYLQAIRTNDDGISCSGVFADGVTVNIDLGSSCSNPLSCVAGQRVSVTNNGSTTAIANPQNQDAGQNYTGVPLTFTSNSRAPIVLNYNDAGAIQLNARYNIPLGTGAASGNLMTGNSNVFVVRPFGFELDFSNDRATNGITGPSYAADANGSLFQVAGASFPVSLSAVVWDSADDTDNDGVPDACAELSDNAITNNFGNEITAIIPADVILANTLAAPAGGDPGTLTTIANDATFAGGTGNKTISWNEAGIMNLNATLSSYLVTGQDISGNVCDVGRFYPNNFAIANMVIRNRSDIIACADPFTYMGENFRIDYDLQAVSINSPANITQNYIGNFAKLDTTSLVEMNYGAADSAVNLTARLSVASTGVFTGGVAPVTAILQLARNASPDGEYSNLGVGVTPTDDDGVSLLPTELDLSLDGGANTHKLLGQTDIRYGRLNLQNNFGSELLTLTMPLSAEYYLNSASEFVTNLDDSCTTRTPADVLLYNDQEVKASRAAGNTVININGANSTTLTGISAFVGGQATLTFTAPGVEGHVNVEVLTPDWLLSNIDGIDHGIQGPGQHCVPGLVVSDPAYIAGCTADGDLVDETPLGRGNFGIFKGSNNVIYTRETY